MMLTLLSALAAGIAVLLVRPGRRALPDARHPAAGSTQRPDRSRRPDRSGRPGPVSRPDASTRLDPDRVGSVPPAPGGEVPGAVVADLVAAVLTAGLPAEAALQAVHRQAGGVEPAGLESVRQALDLAVATGLAPGDLVRAAAAEQRRDRAAAQVHAARRLGVLVVLPVGLCLLPAFVAVTVVPLVLALLGRTLG